MTEPLVSIIIPAYNSGKYIKECLDSVLNQTYQNWEAIVIYSPSNDNTLIALEDYLFEPRIHLIIEKKKGNCAIARNTGLEVAKGKYIAMLDSDDWWQPAKLEIMVNHLESHPELSWCAHCVTAHYPKGITLERVWPGKEYGIGGVAAILFRRECLQNVKKKWGYIFNPTMDRADDADLVLRVRNEPSELLPYFLSDYRWNLEGLSANTDGVRQSWILVDMCIRNKAYTFLPHHIRELAINWINELTGIDWVAEKKRLLG
jgi:glycosyltransferase involved in cell wall biosynthesis